MAYYFDSNPNTISKEKIINVIIQNKKFSFITDNSVFSKKGLDFGTRTLLESLDISEIAGKILDFGCGYGPIGIFLASFGKEVDMIDINKRALNLTLKNAKRNNVKVNAFISNIYDQVHEKYDYIISNPPIRVGKDTLYQILFGATKFLNKGGHLIFVVHKDQGAKTLAKKLETKYVVEIRDKNKGFYVIDCQSY